MDTTRIPRPPVAVRDADARTLFTVYLQDHHAAATGLVELAKRSARSNRDEPLGGFLRGLVAGLQTTLEAIEAVMRHHAVTPSPVKAPLAVVAERLGRGKLNGQLVGYSPLSRLVELEGLAAGVEMEHQFWLTLSQLPAGALPATVDVSERITRSRKQRDELEEHRADAAVAAFGDLPAPAVEHA